MPSTATYFDIDEAINPALNLLLVEPVIVSESTAGRFTLSISEGDWSGYTVSFLGADFIYIQGTPYSGEILGIEASGPAEDVFLVFDWTDDAGRQAGSGIELDTFWQQQPNWRVTNTLFAVDTLIGSDAVDIIHGLQSPSMSNGPTATGGGSADIFDGTFLSAEGGLGSDSFDAASGTFYGGEGNETIHGGGEEKTIFGGAGDDVFLDDGGLTHFYDSVEPPVHHFDGGDGFDQIFLSGPRVGSHNYSYFFRYEAPNVE